MGQTNERTFNVYLVKILHPSDGSSFSYNNVDLNWTHNITNQDWCGYSLDGAANVTLAGNTTLL
jgi:hypothetical protein